MATTPFEPGGRYMVDRQNRVKAAALALIVGAAIGYALVSGLTVDFRQQAEDALKLFQIAPPPPPPPPVEPPQPAPRDTTKPEGAASPPNIESKHTEVVAPKPKVTPPPPEPPVVTAPKAGEGSDATAGSSDKPGPGTGSGGIGDGTGSGGSGNGGGGGRAVTPPRQIAGRITNRDFPREALNGAGGSVGVIFDVMPDGRTANCEIMHSSGNIALDNATCTLILRRFRFRPARDRAGNPVRSSIVENHNWMIE